MTMQEDWETDPVLVRVFRDGDYSQFESDECFPECPEWFDWMNVDPRLPKNLIVNEEKRQGRPIFESLDVNGTLLTNLVLNEEGQGRLIFESLEVDATLPKTLMRNEEESQEKGSIKACTTHPKFESLNMDADLAKILTVNEYESQEKGSIKACTTHPKFESLDMDADLAKIPTVNEYESQGHPMFESMDMDADLAKLLIVNEDESQGHPMFESMDLDADLAKLLIVNEYESQGHPMLESLDVNATLPKSVMFNEEEIQGHPMFESMDMDADLAKLLIVNEDESQGHPMFESMDMDAELAKIVIVNEDESQGHPMSKSLDVNATLPKSVMLNEEESQGHPMYELMDVDAALPKSLKLDDEEIERLSKRKMSVDNISAKKTGNINILLTRADHRPSAFSMKLNTKNLPDLPLTFENVNMEVTCDKQKSPSTFDEMGQDRDLVPAVPNTLKNVNVELISTKRRTRSRFRTTIYSKYAADLPLKFDNVQLQLTSDNATGSQCCHCLRMFKNQRGLNMHIRLKHKEHQEPSHVMTIVDGEGCKPQKPAAKIKAVKEHQCSECLGYFKTPQTLAAHMKRHMGRKFNCEECNTFYINDTALRNHKKREHKYQQRALLQTSMKPVFKCRFCAFSSPSQPKKRKHEIEQHTGKPFRCTLCRKEYILPKPMRTHMYDIHRVKITQDELREMYFENCRYTGTFTDPL